MSILLLFTRYLTPFTTTVKTIASKTRSYILNSKTRTYTFSAKTRSFTFAAQNRITNFESD